MCDTVIIRIGDKHSVNLSIQNCFQSKVLCDMLINRIKNTNISPEIYINTDSPETIEKFIGLLEGKTYKVTVPEYLRFLILSKKFDTPLLETRLRKQLEDFLFRSPYINIENVVSFLEISEDFNLKRVEKMCLFLIEKHGSAVLKTKAFLELHKRTVVKILQRDICLENEIDAWNAIVCWGKHQIQGLKIPPEDQERKLCALLDDLWELVRFPFIDTKELLEIVMKSKLVPSYYYFQALEYKVDPVRSMYKKKDRTRCKGIRRVVNNLLVHM